MLVCMRCRYTLATTISFFDIVVFPCLFSNNSRMWNLFFTHLLILFFFHFHLTFFSLFSLAVSRLSLLLSFYLTFLSPFPTFHLIFVPPLSLSNFLSFTFFYLTFPSLFSPFYPIFVSPFPVPRAGAESQKADGTERTKRVRPAREREREGPNRSGE